MITIHIVAGPHCSLKTSWFKCAFKDTLSFSAEDLFNELSSEPILMKNNYLTNNFEDIWMNTIVKAIERGSDDTSIAVDGVTLDDRRLAYNFSTAEAVHRFIDILKDAAAQGFLHKQLQFVIHWLALPLPLRQILNHRTPHPYNTRQLRYTTYWDTAALEPNITVQIHNTDEVFNAFYIRQLS